MAFLTSYHFSHVFPLTAFLSSIVLREALGEVLSFRNFLDQSNVTAKPLNEKERANFTRMAYGSDLDANTTADPETLQQKLLSNINVLFVSFPRQPGEIYFREVPNNLALLLDPSEFLRISSGDTLDNLPSQRQLEKSKSSNIARFPFTETFSPDLTSKNFRV